MVSHPFRKLSTSESYPPLLNYESEMLRIQRGRRRSEPTTLKTDKSDVEYFPQPLRKYSDITGEISHRLQKERLKELPSHETYFNLQPEPVNTDPQPEQDGAHNNNCCTIL